MKRIAVIFEGDISKRLGVFNVAVQRAKHLAAITPCPVDIFLIQVYDGPLTARLRHSEQPAERHEQITVDGMVINVRWLRRHLIDAIAHRLSISTEPLLNRGLIAFARELSDFDVICAHDRIAGKVALAAKQINSAKCIITWHGTSIHTDPPRDALIYHETSALLSSADINCFVSQGLERKARELFPSIAFKSIILLNAAAPQFRRFSDEERARLRSEYGVLNKKVVTFVGRFSPVKNVTLLPEIFAEILRLRSEAHAQEDIEFWAIGDGEQISQVQALMHSKSGVNCRFWGNLPAEVMPALLNCSDLLVLPSRLEGLPLVVIEALACGANVVATDVVGTAEAIGKENAVPLNRDLIPNIAHKAVQMLSGRVTQALPPQISWTRTAQKELDLIKSLF